MQRFTKILSACAAGLTCLLLANCSQPQLEATFHGEDNPNLLSDWGVFDISSGALVLSDGVVPYDLNTPLFTDYAHKLRTIWIPDGAQTAAFIADDYPGFPVGTVISKTFYYPQGPEGSSVVLKVSDVEGQLNPALDNLSEVRLMETRLLVRRDSGWDAISYVWNAEQTDAILTKIGDAQSLVLVDEDENQSEFAYIVPNINQCAGCHAPNNTTREIAPLGVRPRHLNKAYLHDDRRVNQLTYFAEQDMLADVPNPDLIARNANWTDRSTDLNARARSYLDINCSHCHNPVGPADTSGLDLTMASAFGPELGVCKLPIAAGAGTGGLAYSIVPNEPDASILLHRMEETSPGAMMPELGRSLQHAEGVALIRAWIAEMDGECSS
ncbi:MAG: SO2930 family diheme c-type cytochrome [Pseudomonadota bacterium]